MRLALSAISVAFLLFGCGHAGPLVPRLPSGPIAAQQVTAAYGPYLQGLRAEVLALHGARSLAGQRRLRALSRGRDRLLDGIERFAVDLRRAEPSAARQRCLRDALTEVEDLCAGRMWRCTTGKPCSGPAIDLGVLDEEKVFTPLPLAQAWLVPTCRDYPGLHCMLNPFTYLVLAPLVALDVAGFFVGSWWWAGQTRVRELALGALPGDRCPRLRRLLGRAMRGAEGSRGPEPGLSSN